MTKHSPLNSDEFAALMAPLGPFEEGVSMAVGVSGGADSMALCLLLKDWITLINGQLTALIVDHGLRPESAAEAEMVMARLKGQGIAAFVLKWQGEKPQTAIEERAREARHTLLADYCLSHGILHLCLAHHAEDQAETLLMRLAKGSGPEGLTGMRPVSPRPFGEVLRPLLAVPSARLKATLVARGQDWVNDPSNDLEKFDRVRLRKSAPLLADLGLDPRGLGKVALRQAIVQEGVEAVLAGWAAENVVIHPAGFAVVADDLGTFPFADMVLSRLIQSMGGANHPPSFQRVRTVLAHLAREQKSTCGGALIARKDGKIIVTREFARIRPFLLRPNIMAIWDRRYYIRTGADCRKSLELQPLGNRKSQLSRPERHWVESLPALVRSQLPVLDTQHGLCLPPMVGYNNELNDKRGLESLHLLPIKALAR